MKGSAKGRYGLQLMVELALQVGRGPVLVDAIAARQGLPPTFLRVLLGSLKAATLADLATRQRALEVDSHGYSI